MAISTVSSARIVNLVNGTTYDVRARAEDGAGNISEGSEVFPGTPRKTLGFWANYRARGGTERGCAAAGGAPMLFAALLALRRKRSRR